MLIDKTTYAVVKIKEEVCLKDKAGFIPYCSYCQQILRKDKNQQWFMPSLNTFWFPSPVAGGNSVFVEHYFQLRMNPHI